MSSLREVNRNSSPEFKPIAAETELKLKATADDFTEFINEMLLAGEFSQGFLMNRLRPKFEEQTGKVFDVKHLGYKKLSKLVASCHVVYGDAEFNRIFPAGFVSEALSSKPPAATSAVKKIKSDSLEQFKVWLGQVVNSEECRKGYNISSIRLDF